MRKARWLAAAAIIAVFMCSVVAFAASVDPSTELSTPGSSEIDLENMQVGDIVYIGNTAIQRVADDDEGPSDSIARTTTEGFSVTSFAGNQSLDKTLSLNSTYRYFFIRVNNTSNNKIQVTIGNDETTQTNNFHQIAQGKYYIWSTNQWPAESQTVSFSNGGGMYGSAAARLCSTLAEAEAHNG